MPFTRPTLPEIKERIGADIETRLNTGKLLPVSFLGIMSVAYAGAVHLLHGHIEWATRQLFPDTADDEYAERWASIWGIEKTPPSFASGSVIFTGSDGSIIPEGTRLRRSDGAFYLTTESAVISSGTATVAVKPVNAGSAGDMEAGVSVELVNSLSGIDTEAETASGGITGGEDSESIESLRLRTLDRIKQPPHGGAEFDYIKWAKEVNGVTRAWAYPLAMGAGTVSVTFVQDGEDDIIPDSAKVAEVQEYIEGPTRKPVTAALTVFAPTAVPLNFSITTNPDSPEIRENIENSLRDLLLRTAEPGATILISKIREAVSIASGEEDNTVTSPAANVAHGTSEIAIFGAITWS